VYTNTALIQYWEWEWNGCIWWPTQGNAISIYTVSPWPCFRVRSRLLSGSLQTLHCFSGGPQSCLHLHHDAAVPLYALHHIWGTIKDGSFTFG